MNLVEKKEPQKVGAGNNKIGNNLKNQPEKGGIGGGKDKNVNIDTEIPSKSPSLAATWKMPYITHVYMPSSNPTISSPIHSPSTSPSRMSSRAPSRTPSNPPSRTPSIFSSKPSDKDTNETSENELGENSEDNKTIEPSASPITIENNTQMMYIRYSVMVGRILQASSQSGGAMSNAQEKSTAVGDSTNPESSNFKLLRSEDILKSQNPNFLQKILHSTNDLLCQNLASNNVYNLTFILGKQESPSSGKEFTTYCSGGSIDNPNSLITTKNLDESLTVFLTYPTLHSASLVDQNMGSNHNRRVNTPSEVEKASYQNFNWVQVAIPYLIVQTEPGFLKSLEEYESTDVGEEDIFNDSFEITPSSNQLEQFVNSIALKRIDNGDMSKMSENDWFLASSSVGEETVVFPYILSALQNNDQILHEDNDVTNSTESGTGNEQSMPSQNPKGTQHSHKHASHRQRLETPLSDPTRVIGLILLLIISIITAYLIIAAKQRKRSQEMEAWKTDSVFGGLSTEEGLNFVLGSSVDPSSIASSFDGGSRDSKREKDDAKADIFKNEFFDSKTGDLVLGCISTSSSYSSGPTKLARGNISKGYLA